jgi:hypothetical protein
LSIEPFKRRRALVHRPCVLLVAACFVVRVEAASMDFRPSLRFGLFHDGNINVIGVGQGDDVAALSFDFVWDRNTPTTKFGLVYRPTYVYYRQASNLDYFANTLEVDFTKEGSNQSQVNVSGFFTRTDRQGQTQFTADRATTYVPRSTQTIVSLDIDGTVPAGRRGFLDWRVRGGVNLYTDLADNPDTPAVDPIDFNDSGWYSGRLDWRQEISARNTVGLGFAAGHFGYELTPGVVVASLGLVGTYQAGPLWNLDYAVVGSRATSDGSSDNGFTFDVTIQYAAGRASTFEAGARQVFAPGTGVGGATQDLGAWVSYSRNRTERGLFGQALGGYWKRTALEFDAPATVGDTETFNVAGSMGWAFNRFVALEAAYAFIDQKGTNGANSGFDTTYSTYGIYLRWAIRGR